MLTHTQAPAQIGKYEILGEIGHGGMATVYRARDTRLERLVALKVMHPHLRGAGEARARFAREAVTVARLRHPNILEIYDYSGEDAGDVSFIATELLTGPTLKQFVEQHAEIPAELAACIVIAIARALSAAHAEGVIHRDVKPENVLLHEARTVKLTDFGIAQLIDAQSMTTTGTVLGSPGHMAPEQVEGKECDVRSDIFALGTVLYLLAAGRLPFVGRNPHQVLKAIVDGTFTDPQQARPSMGGQLRRIILRAMHRDPAQRYQTASELSQDLTQFVAQVGITDPIATLAAYLAAPDAFALEFRQKLIERLTVDGEQAVKARDVPRAFDCFNRVLALDEGNARVLEALSRLNRTSTLRRVVLVAAVIGVTLGSAAAAIHLTRVEPDAGAATPPVRVETPAPRDTPAKVVSVPPVPNDATRVTPATGVDPVTRTKLSRPATRAPVGDGVTPRRVVFQPSPANVSIGIDGATPVPYGPSFREATLTPGTHHFKLVGGHDCCVDLDVTETIPSGPGITTLSYRLKFRPAALYVVSNVPADVRVDDGLVRGRSRAVIDVPLEQRLRENHSVTVSASGHRDQTVDIQLSAGQLSTVPVTLVPNP